MEHGDPGWKKAMYGIDETFEHDCNMALITIDNRGPRGGIKEPTYMVVRLDLLPISEPKIIATFLYCAKTEKKTIGGREYEFLDQEECFLVENWMAG